MSKQLADRLNSTLRKKSTEEVLDYFLNHYEESSALSSSLAAEDQVLTDLILKKYPKTKIFTLDTGRLNPETYDVMDATNIKYNFKMDVYFPNEQDVQKLYKMQGVNGQYESIENRKTCCGVRKIEPLKRALKDLDIWFTGLRASQSVTRTKMRLVDWDEGFQIIKVNALIAWSEEDVWNYIKEHNIPYNKLHDMGFPSIGCAPCTRAVEKGEDIRAGRWWWENPEHKECGLHNK